jgi:tape measure domain-containing protein
MKALNFVFRLMDRASGPAKQIGMSVEGVDRRLTSLGRQSTMTERALSRGLSLPQAHARALALSLRAVGVASRALDTARLRAERLRLSLQHIRGVAGMIFSLPTLIMGGALGIAGGMAIQSASFKENTLTAFEVMLDSAKEAERIFAEAIDFASRTPFSTRQVTGAYQQLLAFRFDPIEVPIVLAAVGDLAALKGFDPQVIQRVTMALGQIKSKGRLQGEEMLQLAESGVSTGLVYEILAEKLNTTTDAVRKLQEAGNISADLGLPAILEAIRRSVSGGELGGLMARQSQTLAGLASTAASRPFELTMDLDESDAFASLKKILRNFNVITDDTNAVGKKFKRIVEETFGSVLETVFAPLESATNPAKVSRNLDGWISAGERFKVWWESTIPPLVARMRELFRGVGETTRILRGDFRVLGGGFWQLIGNVLGVVGAFKLLNLLTLGLSGGMVRLALTGVKGLLFWLGRLAWRLIWINGLMKTALVMDIVTDPRGILPALLAKLKAVGAAALAAGRQAIVAGFMMARAWLVALGPIGWIILAITAIVGAAVWAYHRFEWFRNGVNAVWDGIKVAALAAWRGIRTAIDEFLEWITGVPDRIMAVFAGLPDRMLEMGRNLGRSITDGINSGIQSAGQGLANAGNWLLDNTVGRFQRDIDAHSPSRVFAKLGLAIPQGIERGILQGQSFVNRATERLAMAATGGFAPALAGVGTGALAPIPSSGRGGFNVTAHFTVNVQAQAGEDLQAAAYRAGEAAAEGWFHRFESMLIEEGIDDE